MTSSPKPLPDQWTINLHPVANLTILTLLDDAGVQREIGFSPLTPPGTTDRTVGALSEIADPGLRASAQKLISTFYERTARAQANADAFGAAVPDQRHLFDRLRSVVPGCLIELDVDDETLAVILKMTATGSAAGALLSLVARWPGSITADGQADGITQDLDGGDLSMRLDQAHAEDFLTWFRSQP